MSQNRFTNMIRPDSQGLQLDMIAFLNPLATIRVSFITVGYQHNKFTFTYLKVTIA